MTDTLRTVVLIAAAAAAMSSAAAVLAAPGDTDLLTIDTIFAEGPDRVPSSLAWNPTGDRLAYTFDDGDGKALWVIEATQDAQPVKIVSEGDATLADLDGYRWSPEGDSFLIESDGDLYAVDPTTRVAHPLTQTEAKEEAGRVFAGRNANLVCAQRRSLPAPGRRRPRTAPDPRRCARRGLQRQNRLGVLGGDLGSRRHRLLVVSGRCIDRLLPLRRSDRGTLSPDEIPRRRLPGGQVAEIPQSRDRQPVGQRRYSRPRKRRDDLAADRWRRGIIPGSGRLVAGQPKTRSTTSQSRPESTPDSPLRQRHRRVRRSSRRTGGHLDQPHLRSPFSAVR